MTTFIKEIQFRGFKSFGDQFVSVKMGKGFTCVVGPNGSGKSNIIDGLCFALGRLSKKTMRAENLKDLIFVGTKTKKPANRAEVTIVFDNSENTFPGFPGEDLAISREVSDKGKGTYRLNGKRVTREEILMNLALANVDPDGFNFILQGKIVELTHMSPDDRRQFIEDLVGLQKFDEEKAAALRELEKADQDLVKFEAIFQEVARQLKAVEKEKNDALRWLELDNTIKELNARLVALNIKKLRDEEEQVLIFISETKKKIEELADEITTCSNDIDRETSVMNELTRELETYELNRNDLETKISNMRSDLSSKKTELKILSESMEKLQERKRLLEEKQEKLGAGETYDQLLAATQEEMDALAIQMAKTRSDIQDKENMEKKLEGEITIFQQELNAFNKKLNAASSSKSSLETELKLTKERLVKAENKKVSLEKDLAKLLKDKNDNVDEAMAAADKEAREIQGEIDQVKLELKKETQKQKNFETEINQLRSQVAKFDQQIADQKSKVQIAKSQQEIFGKQVHDIKRETKTMELNKVKFDEEIQRLTKEVQKTKDQLAAKTKLIDDLKQERDNVQKNLEDSQKEYEGVEEEIFALMSNLELLTDNYSIGVSTLNAEAQATGMDAVENSMQDFKLYIMDLVEMIETVKNMVEESKKEELKDAFMSLDMFLENYEDGLGSLKTEIQDKINGLVQSNSEEFSSYLQGIMDFMSTVHIALRKLKMTRNAELIGALHELDNKKSALQDDYNATNVAKTKLEGELKQATLEFKNIEAKMKAADTQVADLEKNIQDKNKGIEEAEAKAATLVTEKDGVNQKIEEKNKIKDEFWELSNRLNQDIEEKNKLLQGVQDRIRGLQTVQKLIRDIGEQETEITESTQKIASNTEKIAVLEKDIKDIEDAKVQKEKDTQDVRKQKDAVSQEQRDLRTKAEEENKLLQAKQRRHGQLAAMIQRAKEIGDMDEELDGNARALDEGDKAVASMAEQAKVLDARKAEVVEHIGKLNGSKQSVWERQKDLQEQLTKLNTAMGTSTNKLSNFEARKDEIGVKIEDLYEQSKEFGTLPQVLEGWTETGIKGDIAKASDEKRILEPVNLKSIEQYEVVKNRFDDIDLRRQSLQRERKAILENIERIELEKTRQFMRAFNEINLHFSEIFTKLSPGGIAKMLLENPAKPFEGGIVIEARPRGKKITSIESLSGGEKTLVALSFIFSVERFQPAPFYIMDEIDAALDGPNVHRVSMLIQEFSKSSQFIVISHREENIVNADKIYGVSMKDSITDIFSIKMEEMEAIDEARTMDDLLDEEDGAAG